MKHLLTAIACCVTFAVGAQTGQIDLPYNPDADQDSLIGTTDLLPLLALYGGEFEPDEILIEDVALVDVILSMQATIAELQAQVAALEAQSMPELANHLTYVDSSSTLLLEGVNLQLTNGAGPYNTNGLGNLIIGMNGDEEADATVGRGGSHNLVIGEDHAYSNTHGILHGYQATLTDRYAASIGGANNRIEGAYSAVVGGQDNQVTGQFAAALSGVGNVAGGVRSATIGGNFNEALGQDAVTVGGNSNDLTSSIAVIVGGEMNAITGDSSDARHSVVLGGRFADLNAGYCGVIAGGYNNILAPDTLGDGPQARSIFGGQWNNNAGGTSSTMMGGSSNQLNQRPGGAHDATIGVNTFIGNVMFDNTQNIRVTGAPLEE